MSILFINGSPNKNGATARLANALLEGRAHDTLTLADYKIYGYGQHYEDDELEKVLAEMKRSDTIIIGSPVYWHNLSAAVRNLLERLYGSLGRQDLAGKRLFLLFQGASPEKWMIEAGEYSINMFAKLYGLRYMGMATTEAEAKKLSVRI